MSNVTKQAGSVVLLVLTAALLQMDSVSAQQRIRSPIERRQHPGRGFWENQRAARSIQHARDYSRDLYRYSRDAETVQTEVAQSESEELARNIKKAEKELAEVAKQYKGDKEVEAAMKKIKEHLARAAEVHKRLHEECCKDAPDASTTMECCSDISKELDQAAAEHAALMRTLEVRARAKRGGDAGNSDR